MLFSLPAIIAAIWYECELRPLHRDELAGIRLRFLHQSQGWVSSSDYQRNWKADQHGIWGQLDSQKGLHLIQNPRAKMRQLDSPIPSQCQSPTHPILAGETSRDNTSHPATIAPPFSRSSAGGLESATRGADTTFQPSEAARQKADDLSRSIQAKGGNEKAESWDESEWID